MLRQMLTRVYSLLEAFESYVSSSTEKYWHTLLDTTGILMYAIHSKHAHKNWQQLKVTYDRMREILRNINSKFCID